MLRCASLILLVPLLAACATTEQNVSSSDPRATAPSTRYRQGDFIVYRYSGAFSSAPVTLREEVRAQEGNRLRIDVTATRGAEERRWIQVLTDTPENQRNNVIDALYELIDGKPVKLEHKDNRDAFRLYEWILVMPEGRATDLQQGPCERVLGGTRSACTCTTGKNSWPGRAIHFEEAECPDFLWTHADGRFWDPSSGEDVHRGNERVPRQSTGKVTPPICAPGVTPAAVPRPPARSLRRRTLVPRVQTPHAAPHARARSSGR